MKVLHKASFHFSMNENSMIFAFSKDKKSHQGPFGENGGRFVPVCGIALVAI